MALKATIAKASLTVSDMDRGYYATHALTVARHPSETDERMMVRVLAFALHADPALAFGRGLSADDEPDLWQHDPTGVLLRWIDVGLPDERLLRKAAGRAREVFVYAYGGRAVDLWWQRGAPSLERLPRLTVRNLPPETTQGLAGLAARNMQLTCTVQDGHVYFSDEATTLAIELATVWPAP